MPDAVDSSSATTDGSGPGQDDWAKLDWKTSGAICCSGGGIRSASYCLGALQALDAAGVEPRLVTAVSGGSYIAAARSLQWQGFDPADDPDPEAGSSATGGSAPDATDRPLPYQPHSPEEQHLRTHTHYVAPSFRIGLIGAASLVVGALITVALVASLLFVFGRVWGALLGPAHVDVLTGLNTPHPAATLSNWGWWVWPVAAWGVAILSFVVIGTPGTVRSGREGRPSRLAVQAASAAVVLSIAMLLIPLAVAGLFRFGLYNDGAAGTIVRSLGFTSAAGCESAYAGQRALLPDVGHPTVCGKTVQDKPKSFGAQSGNPLSRLPAFLAAVAALAKAASGRWSSATRGGQGTSWVGGLTRAVRGFVVPWIGTIVIVAAFSLALLRWTGDGTLHGFHWNVLLILLIPLLGRSLVDVNRMSLHDFYRWRLSEAYGYSTKLANTKHPRPKDLANARARRLSELRRGPMLAICTAANADSYGETPVGLDAFLFRFDRDHATLYGPPKGGQERIVRARTKDYEALAGLSLFDLVAISGAAVSPLMGKATRQAMRILLTVANARLGVWLPNPAVVHDARTWVDTHSFHSFAAGQQPPGSCATCGYKEKFEAHKPPNGTNLNWNKDTKLGKKPRWPLSAVLGHLVMGRRHAGVLWGHVLWYQERANQNKAGSRSWHARFLWRAMQPTLGLLWKEAVASSGYRQEWVYVSDGGHYENLGLVAALRDEAIHYVVSLDASGDKTDTWNTMGQAIALAQTDASIEIGLDPTIMKGSATDAGGYVGQAFARGTFLRPAVESGVPSTEQKTFLLTCKLGVWNGAPWNVRSYAATHPAFPCTSTGQQLYDGDEFEAYRALGVASVRAAAMPPPLSLEDTAESIVHTDDATAPIAP